MRTRRSGVLAPLLLVLGACSGSESGGGEPPALDRSEVEQQVRATLEETVGREPEEVACPDDLRAEVGRTIRCTLTDSGTSVGVTVTVLSFADDVATYDVQVDEVAQ